MLAYISACLSLKTVHFSMAGIEGGTEAYEDAEDDGGYLADEVFYG